MIGQFLLSELAMPTGGRLLGDDAVITGVSIDSRSLRPGELFVPLRGPRYDGHDFILAAQERAAAATLTARPMPLGLPGLLVPDTTAALSKLAEMVRGRFSGRMVAVTGSAGKTTTKEMIASVLSAVAPTLATKRNENNEIGVPLTLLALEERHRFAVLEMGASRRRDIDHLARLARPHVAVVTNALPAHLEGFGTLADVAAGKSEIYRHIEAGGIGIVNLDSEHADAWRRMAVPYRIVTFSTRNRYADCFAYEIEERPLGATRFMLRSPHGAVAVELPLFGRHNVSNALAAAAAAYACGCGSALIAAGLARVLPCAGRLQTKVAADGLTIIDDSYNANPASMRAAIDALAACPSPRALISGSMAELGVDADRFHREIGVYARQRDIDGVFSCGEYSHAVAEAYGDGGHCYADCAALMRALRTHRRRFGVFLVKGSRAAGMERVVDSLLSLRADAED